MNMSSGCLAGQFPRPVLVRPSALDDPNQFDPQIAVWTSSAAAWSIITLKDRIQL
jgi:hypothetical protein